MRASKGPKDRVVESDRKSSETYSCPPSPVRAVGVTSRASGCPVTGTDDASDVGVNVKLAATSPAMLATWLPSGAYSRTAMRSVTSLTRGMWLVTSRFWSNSRTDARPCGGGGAVGERERTRLKSRHPFISYAVFFFLKKKTKKPQ